jgi:hypothetical protein
MIQSGNQNFFIKKAYEITYAIFRIAPKVLDGNMAQKMNAEAMELLASAAAENHLQATKSLEVLNYLVKFGIDLNFIGFMNGDVLLREINNLHASIAEFINEANKDVDISGIFSSGEFLFTDTPVVSGEIKNRTPDRPMGHSEASAEESHGSIGSFAFAQDDKDKNDSRPKPIHTPSGNIIRSGMRQIAILDRIRQSGNCRLRDIQDVLPDCSERTIRYDLEDLIERNIIERMGHGGPSVSYRMRQIV